MKFQTEINGRAGSLSIEGNHLAFQPHEGVPFSSDFSCEATREGEYSVLLNGRGYSVVALGDKDVSVNGIAMRAEVFDPRGLRGRRSGETDGGPKSISALMPGRVVQVLVEPGQAVEAGQGVIVVEAMKMQNEMKAPRAGVVTQVKAQANTAVAAGDVLIVIE